MNMLQRRGVAYAVKCLAMLLVVSLVRVPTALASCGPCETETCAFNLCICFPAPGAPCDDGNPCTGPDVCDSLLSCVGPPISGPACDDGKFCTVNDTCADGECVG